MLAAPEFSQKRHVWLSLKVVWNHMQNILKNVFVPNRLDYHIFITTNYGQLQFFWHSLDFVSKSSSGLRRYIFSKQNSFQSCTLLITIWNVAVHLCQLFGDKLTLKFYSSGTNTEINSGGTNRRYPDMIVLSNYPKWVLNFELYMFFCWDVSS